MHPLHLFFSILIGTYFTDRNIFSFVGEIPVEGLPQVVDIPGESFTVRHAVRAVPRVDHLVHMEIVSSPCWQSMLCKKVENLQEDG